MYKELHIGVAIPALNEERSIGRVVRQLRSLTYDNRQLVDLIVVCDNNSDDQTAAIAQQAGARVVFEPRRGYGSACLCALRYLEGVDVVLFIDADSADDPQQASRLLHEIYRGAELVIGSRHLGNCEPGSLAPLQRWGNRLIVALIRLLWRYPVTDLGPFRAIRVSSLSLLAMQDKNYGWTVEMQLKAFARGMRIVEVPVNYRRRIGQSKISGNWRTALAAGTKILIMIVKLRLRRL